MRRFPNNFQKISIHSREASNKTEERFGLDLGQRLPSPFTLALGPDELFFAVEGCGPRASPFCGDLRGAVVLRQALTRAEGT